MVFSIQRNEKQLLLYSQLHGNLITYIKTGIEFLKYKNHNERKQKYKTGNNRYTQVSIKNTKTILLSIIYFSVKS